MQTIGERIARLRTDANLTQAALAEKLGITDRAVSKWETGGAWPDLSLVPALADLFGVSIDYLLRGKSHTVQELKVIRLWDDRHVDGINREYLQKGWKIVHIQATDSEDDYLGAIVLEKTVWDE